MISYIKNLFNGANPLCVKKDYKFDPYTTPQTLTEKFDISNVKEPATSFVECVKNNRKRFRVRCDAYGWCNLSVKYVIVDTQTGKGWAVHRDTDNFHIGLMWDVSRNTRGVYVRMDSTLDETQISYNYIGFPEWLNKDEIIYIYRELTKFYSQLLKSKSKRRQQLAFRAERDKEKNLLKERQLMVDTYC
jgi:hypothetical protein